jgi:iron complex outermembrane receptor protein
VVNNDPGSSRFYPNDIYSMSENNSAAYMQLNFGNSSWGGNFGVRYIATKENIGYTSPTIQGTDYQNGSPPSAFYPNGWYWNYSKHHYGKLLPSFNFKVNLNDDGSLLARFAASQTLTRQDYGQLAGFLSLSDPQSATGTGSGSGPNPNLKPLISTNFDASLEWYFSERGLLSASVYEMDMSNYYDYGTVNGTYLNNYLTYGGGGTNPSHTPVYSNYLVSIPVNVNGNLKGVELNYIQPIGDHFGASVNYTYANGHSTGGTFLYNPDGTPGSNVAGNRPLFGSSRNTANLSAYYEDSRWNARINYTYRSSFYDGMMAVQGGLLGNTMPLLPYYQAGTGYLSFSAGYKLNDHVSFSFDAMNLNNPTLRYYVLGSQAGLGFGKVPEAFYTNGRQYYFNVNFKL